MSAVQLARTLCRARREQAVIERMSTDELYAELQEIDASPHYGSEKRERALKSRAARIERELERRAEEE